MSRLVEMVSGCLYIILTRRYQHCSSLCYARYGSPWCTPRHQHLHPADQGGSNHSYWFHLKWSRLPRTFILACLLAFADLQGVGPEHAMLHASGRGKYIVATDEDCLRAFVLITQKEGILPALESAHAVWGGIQLAKTLPKDKNIVIVSLNVRDALSLTIRPCPVVVTRTLSPCRSFLVRVDPGPTGSASSFPTSRVVKHASHLSTSRMCMMSPIFACSSKWPPRADETSTSSTPGISTGPSPATFKPELITAALETTSCNLPSATPGVKLTSQRLREHNRSSSRHSPADELLPVSISSTHPEMEQMARR